MNDQRTIENPLEELLEESPGDSNDIHWYHPDCQEDQLRVRMFCGKWLDSLDYAGRDIDREVNCVGCHLAMICPRCGASLTHYPRD